VRLPISTIPSSTTLLSSSRKLAGSCFGYLAYLSTKDPARIEDMIQHSSSFLKDAMASDPDNPRLLWVLGPIRWSSPPERGGGQDKAFDLYQRGLKAVRTRPALSDPLEPCWGEPELLMNRAWSNLHRTTTDRKAAQNDAAAALTLVPYWLYVRDLFCRKFKMLRPRRADCPGRRRGFLFLSAALCEKRLGILTLTVISICTRFPQIVVRR
jgi:hypothetical protein